VLDGAVLTEVDFSGRRFRGLTSTGAVLDGCDFRRTTIEYGPLGYADPTVFRNCSFERATLAGVGPGTATFESCDFTGAKIVEWFAFCAEFVDCVFATTLTRCKFSGRPFECHGSVLRERNAFHGNDFRKATLVDCLLVGIDLDRQQLPDDAAYIALDRVGERLQAARTEIVHWPDSDERREALLMIDIVGSWAEGEEDLFVRREDLGGPSSTRALVWALLERPG
jgi:uncharacterized protein YjbI with pentapeptide repeats